MLSFPEFKKNYLKHRKEIDRKNEKVLFSLIKLQEIIGNTSELTSNLSSLSSICCLNESYIFFSDLTEKVKENLRKIILNNSNKTSRKLKILNIQDSFNHPREKKSTYTTINRKESMKSLIAENQLNIKKENKSFEKNWEKKLIRSTAKLNLNKTLNLNYNLHVQRNSNNSFNNPLITSNLPYIRKSVRFSNLTQINNSNEINDSIRNSLSKNYSNDGQQKKKPFILDFFNLNNKIANNTNNSFKKEAKKTSLPRKNKTKNSNESASKTGVLQKQTSKMVNHCILLDSNIEKEKREIRKQKTLVKRKEKEKEKKEEDGVFSNPSSNPKNAFNALSFLTKMKINGKDKEKVMEKENEKGRSSKLNSEIRDSMEVVMNPKSIMKVFGKYKNSKQKLPTVKDEDLSSMKNQNSKESKLPSFSLGKLFNRRQTINLENNTTENSMNKKQQKRTGIFINPNNTKLSKSNSKKNISILSKFGSHSELMPQKKTNQGKSNITNENIVENSPKLERKLTEKIEDLINQQNQEKELMQNTELIGDYFKESLYQIIKFTNLGSIKIDNDSSSNYSKKQEKDKDKEKKEKNRSKTLKKK